MAGERTDPAPQVAGYATDSEALYDLPPQDGANATGGVGDALVAEQEQSASGLATGKRVHKPFVITMELD